MRTIPISFVLGALALSSLAGNDVQAQVEQSFLRSPGVSIPLHHKNEDGKAEQREKQTFAQNRRVHDNINRHLKEAANLRATGKTEKDISCALAAIPVQAATGSIKGTVYLSDRTTPVSSYISVMAYDEFGTYCNYGYSMGGSGVYQIQNLSPGDYYVQLNSWGTADCIPLYYNDMVDWRQATLVHVTDGQVTTGIDFIFREYQGTIAGRVFTADSLPVAQCAVEAYDMDYNQLNSASADSGGRYIIKGLPSGDFKIRAYGWGSTNYLDQWFEGATTFETAAAVHVVEPETTKGKDFWLAPAGIIAGRVVAEGGEVIPAYACYIYVRDAEGNEIESCPNDSAGAFCIRRLPTGDYTVSYSCYGVGDYISGWYDRATDAAHATPVHVTVPQTTTISVVLQRGGAIAGKISGFLPSYVPVSVYNEKRTLVEQGTSDQNGKYVVSRLPAGRYKVLAGGRDALSQWYNQAADFGHAAVVEVQNADTTKNVDFVLNPGGGITCQVVDPSRTPVNSGSIYLCDINGGMIRGASVSGGLCSFGGLTWGKYKLFYSAPRSSEYASEWLSGKPSAQNAAVVSVTVGGITQFVIFNLKRSGSIGGFVSDGVGDRLTEGQVIATIYDADSGWYVGSSDISFLGGFQPKLLPGNYKVGLFFVNDDFRPSLQDSLGVLYYDHGRSFADSGSKTIALAGGSAVRLDDCAMERTAGAISGNIYVGGTGTPLTSGAYIILAFDAQGRPAAISRYTSEYTPLSGTYRLRGLWPGEYSLLAAGIESSTQNEFAEWFDGIQADYDSLTNVPMPTVPPGARSVTVGTGTTTGIDFHVGPTTAVSLIMPTRPQGFELLQNYPNPFNPETKIGFRVSGPGSRGVKLAVYDLLGREVVVLVNEMKSPGNYEVRFDGSLLSSGMYVYRLIAGEHVASRKMLLVR
jgi:hypothetical protein